MKPTVKTIASQPSWIIRTRQIELAITQRGGHMAPVTFCRDGARPVQPYYISPWQGEKVQIDEPVLTPLRGDFFCMPFGGGPGHPGHGDPATGAWTLAGCAKSDGVTRMTLRMKLKATPGTVTKTLSLVDGQNVIYDRHVIEGVSGAYPLGHHATLAVPEKEGALRIATSPIRFGMTCPELFSDPANGEYQSFAIGAKFTRLDKVPLIFADATPADCTSFPARKGFTDLLAVFNKPSRTPAWTAATNTQQGYVWFSLKDPAMLGSTAFWISNQGRHGSPWLGRNRCLGLEDVCSYFAQGMMKSRKDNLLTKAGIPTTIKLSRTRPTTIHYIQGAVAVPRKFKQVRTIEFGEEGIALVSTAGKKVYVPVKWSFALDGEL